MTRIAFLLAAILMPGLEAGCGNPNASPPASQHATSTVAGEKPLLPEYRTLAAHLSHELKPNVADFRDDKSLSDIIAEGHAAILDLRAVQSDNPDINYIVAQATPALAETLRRLERINALPKPPSNGSVFFESFLHGLYGNVYAGYELGADADNKRKAILDEVTGLSAAIEKLDATHLLLERVAERCSATGRSVPDRLVVDFDGAWNAWGPHDWCGLFNTGNDINDCTVIVELKGANGQTRKNVHFVKKWPGKSWLHARYESGTEVDGRQFGQTTVPDVASLRVRMLSPDFSTDMNYTYTGAEKTKDIRQRVGAVKPHIVPRVRNSAWGASSGKVLVLENRWSHPVYQVGVRVVSATGSSVGEFVKPQLDAGSSMDVGSWQVSRNLTSGDRVTVWLGEAELLTTVVQ